MFGSNRYNNNYYNQDESFQNSNLQIKYKNALSKLENSKKEEDYIKKEYKKLKSMVENLCKSIMSNQYNVNQLGGNSILKNMDVYKMIEFANLDFQNQRIQNKELNNKLMLTIKEQQQIIETLKEQLTQTIVMTNKDLSEDDISNANIINNTSNDNMNVFQNNTFNSDMGMSQSYIEDTPKETKIEVDIFGNIINKETTKKETQFKTNNMPKEQYPQKNQNKFINQNGNNNVNKPIINQSTNNKPVTSMVRDESSMLGDILGMSKPKNNNSVQNNPIINNKNNNNKNNSPTNNSSTLTLENVDSYMAAMTQIMWDIVEVIGKTGLSISNDIIDLINKDEEKYTKSLTLNNITSLAKMNVLTTQEISTGFRRFKIYKLSNKGETMFRAKFGDELVESEIDKIIRDHDNEIHGYTIRDARTLLLENNNCKSANMNRSEISIKIPNGKTYIPDIMAIHEKGYKMYIEVELGNTPQKDFNDKCDKMLQVTKHLYFVTNVEDTIKKKLESQISMWVLNAGGKEKVQGTTIYITTMKQLAKGEWLRKFKY